LKEKCLKLEKSLKYYNLLDIDGFDLFSKLNILRKIISLENDKPIDILNYIKNNKSFFSNEYIAYRIILTISVSISYFSRNEFLKASIIKTYLRLTMSQEILIGLATLSMKDMLNDINYNNSINNFA